MDLFEEEKDVKMTESQAAKTAGIAMIMFIVAILLGVMVGWLMYSNNLMLTSILSKDKQISCDIRMPNDHGIDMLPDAKE